MIYDLEIVETPADPATRVSFSQFPLAMPSPEPLVAIPVPLVANSAAVRTLYINSESSCRGSR